MEAAISGFISSLEFAAPQRCGSMEVIPLLLQAEAMARYISFKEASDRGLVRVTELNTEGRVSALKVVNKAEVPVLMLDGEELCGAKQNRVLNTTVLLSPSSEARVPVSCTEQGRWSYNSDAFACSGIVMNPALRKVKARGVSSSLESSMGFRSDQDAVWNSINEMCRKAEFRSSTDAMKDVVEFMEDDLDAYERAFALLPGQKGLMVFIGGRAEGFDVISRPEVYGNYHARLVRSYAVEAVFKGGGQGPLAGDAGAFVLAALKCGEKSYPSQCMGTDYRYAGDSMIGSALASEGEAVHLAFFRTEGEKETEDTRRFSRARDRKMNRV